MNFLEASLEDICKEELKQAEVIFYQVNCILRAWNDKILSDCMTL